MTSPADLRSEAGLLADPFPPLLAEARRLASTVFMGEHGRRRAGRGEEFWQYRPAHSGDELRQVDWRRSAKSDGHFVRQKEWQSPQTVLIWPDVSASMGYSSHGDVPEKAWVARVLALGLTILLEKGGERVGLAGHSVAPASGRLQVDRIAQALLDEDATNSGTPDLTGLRPNARVVFISDFLWDTSTLRSVLEKAASRGVQGALLQFLDPAEEGFPFAGRTIFESMTGALRYETRKAAGLREKYLAKLAARKEELAQLAHHAGWQFSTHHTDQPNSHALLWLYTVLDRGRA